MRKLSFTVHCQQDRPRGYSTLMVAMASVYANIIKLSSETGRLSGQLYRGQLSRASGGLMRRFDWFGGLKHEVVRGEQAWSVLRFACFTFSAVAATIWL